MTNFHLSDDVSAAEAFAFDPASSAFAAPMPGPHGAMLDYIRGLPEEASPELLGLHSNAQTAKLRNDGTSLQQSALAALPRSVAVAAVAGMTTNAADFSNNNGSL